MGAGIGLAMAPATEAIMGALPQGQGRHRLGDERRRPRGRRARSAIAVLGSVLASAYGRGMDGAVDRPARPTRPPLRRDCVGAAHEVAAQLGGSAGAALLDASNQAFVDAMATTATIAAALASSARSSRSRSSRRGPARGPWGPAAGCCRSRWAA